MQYFASQMVKSVHRLHEKGFGHRQVCLRKFVIRESFEVHMMPSGFEAKIDELSNEILWEKGHSKEFKKKYLPPQANEILKLRAIHDKYIKLNKTSKASEKKVTLYNRALTEFDL